MFKSWKKLPKVKVGKVVELYGPNFNQYKVVKVRNTKKQPLKDDTFRRRSDVIRSSYAVTLQNVKTGRLRTIYNAESILCRVI